MIAALLPPATRAMVRFSGPRPGATSLAWLILESRCGGSFRQDVVGCLTYCPDDLADPSSRLGRWKRRLALRTALGYTLRSVGLEAMAKDRRPLSDEQRFKRKMGMVLRKYEEEKAAIERLERGIPQLAMERLNDELEEAWIQAERIYGCKRTDFYEPTPITT